MQDRLESPTPLRPSEQAAVSSAAPGSTPPGPAAPETYRVRSAPRLDAPDPPAPILAPPAVQAPQFILPQATLAEVNGTLALGAPTGLVTAALSAPAPTVVTSPGSGLSFTLVWDVSVAAAPAGFMPDVVAAARSLESIYTDNVPVNVNVGYGTVGGISVEGSLGRSMTSFVPTSYAQVVDALKRDMKTGTDASAVVSLPAASPVNGDIWVPTAQAKALGLPGVESNTLDASVVFATGSVFTYGAHNPGGTVVPGTYDFFAAVTHELTEVMGRVLLDGIQVGGTGVYDALDLLHFGAPGTRVFTAGTPGYFSVDGGATNLGSFNIVAGGDPGDWATSAQQSPFDAFSTAGTVKTMSSNDLMTLDAIGWDRASGGGALPHAPTGISFQPVTSNLAAAAGTGTLSPGQPVLRIGQTGGTAGDQYTYVLGGPDAASFTLAVSQNTASLAPASPGAAGAQNGQLYALTVTAWDTTTGPSSPVSPLDVIVGGSSGDTISVAALSGGLGVTAPTFIHGMGGADRIDGTGMSGTLWLDGGAGADILTGGSGANDYLYGATTDSTPTMMDIITNFHVSVDMIDLTGLGSPLTFAGQGSSVVKAIAGHTAGFVVSGGDTLLYVNTSSAVELLTAADMKIRVQGVAGLTSANIVHL